MRARVATSRIRKPAAFLPKFPSSARYDAILAFESSGSGDSPEITNPRIISTRKIGPASGAQRCIAPCDIVFPLVRSADVPSGRRGNLRARGPASQRGWRVETTPRTALIDRSRRPAAQLRWRDHRAVGIELGGPLDEELLRRLGLRRRSHDQPQCGLVGVVEDLPYGARL